MKIKKSVHFVDIAVEEDKEDKQEGIEILENEDVNTLEEIRICWYNIYLNMSRINVYYHKSFIWKADMFRYALTFNPMLLKKLKQIKNNY